MSGVPREPALTAWQSAALACISEALGAAWEAYAPTVWPDAPHVFDTHVRLAGFWELAGLAIGDSDGFTFTVAVDDDWVSAVDSPGYAVVDGAFLLRILERDDRGRPLSGIGMQPTVDRIGAYCLVSHPLTVAWAGEHPTVTWLPRARDDWRRACRLSELGQGSQPPPPVS